MDLVCLYNSMQYRATTSKQNENNFEPCNYCDNYELLMEWYMCGIT